MASIQGIYIALFGRPADPEGLEYWTEMTKGGEDLSFLIGRLTAADEYTDLVANKTPTEVINAIYQQLFDRDADPKGLEHYLGLLESGDQSIETIAIDILNGASGSDLLILDAKIDAAELFTASLNLDVEVDAYAGNTAEEVGRDFIDSVKADDRATQAEVDAAIETLLTDGGNSPDEGTPPASGGGGGSSGGNSAFTVTLTEDGQLDFGGRATGPITVTVEDGQLVFTRFGITVTLEDTRAITGIVDDGIVLTSEDGTVFEHTHGYDWESNETVGYWSVRTNEETNEQRVMPRGSVDALLLMSDADEGRIDAQGFNYWNTVRLMDGPGDLLEPSSYGEFSVVGGTGAQIDGIDVGPALSTLNVDNIIIENEGEGEDNSGIKVEQTYGTLEVNVDDTELSGSSDGGAARGILLSVVDENDVVVNVTDSEFSGWTTGIFVGDNSINVEGTSFADHDAAIGSIQSGASIVVSGSTFADALGEHIGVDGNALLEKFDVDTSGNVRVNVYGDGANLITVTDTEETNVILVGPGGSIQAAIDLAALTEGAETIYVGAGDYFENLQIDTTINLIGQDGAVIHGVGNAASTIEVQTGADNSVISNLTVFATAGGNALYTPNANVDGVQVRDNVFDAGENTFGSLVYLNPGANEWTFDSNEFYGEKLQKSPLLGLDTDDIDVTLNYFDVDVPNWATVEIYGTGVLYEDNYGPGANDVGPFND